MAGNLSNVRPFALSFSFNLKTGEKIEIMSYQRTADDLRSVIKHAKLDEKNITKISQV